MERWYWVELIGFDIEAADYGVSAYLSRNQSTDGVSLLFSHMDFLFREGEERLPANACSYAGHEFNRERRRQDWTRTQLRGLIRELQAHRVKVFLSCFDLCSEISDSAYLTYGKDGRPHRHLCVIKPLEGGTVGDVVIEKLAVALREYGFDGLQMADGISSARCSIENGDFSVSLCRRSGIDIPERLMGEDLPGYMARRAWILKHRRFAWIKFLSDAWAGFYQRLFDRIQVPIMFNNAWTLCPFEALYRYGIDYGRCQPDRAYAVMIEENSATRAITAAEDEGGVELSLSYRDRFPYKYALMQQQIKLHTGGLKQISLMPISDTLEQWDALRHCPTELTRAIVRRYHTYVYRDGGFAACSDAPLYCLADGIPAEDWRWIAKQESYRLPPVDFVDGLVGVYNPDTLYAEVEKFCKKRGYFGAALTEELVMGGLPVGAGISLADVPHFERARGLVVTDLGAYTAEQKNVLAQTGLPILAVGEDVDLPIEPAVRYDGTYLSVALYNLSDAPDLSHLAACERTVRSAPSLHGEIWTEPLSFRRISPKFFEEIAESVCAALSLDRSAPDAKPVSYLCGGEKYVLLSNDRHTYSLPTVACNGEIAEATALMKDRGYTVQCRNNTFTVRIPPRGVEMVKVTYKT